MMAFRWMCNPRTWLQVCSTREKAAVLPQTPIQRGRPANSASVYDTLANRASITARGCWRYSALNS